MSRTGIACVSPRSALAAVACVALALAGCLRPGLGKHQEFWADDEGRAVIVTKGIEWVAVWVEAQYCPVTETLRPPERFRLKVDGEGNGVGTLQICRWSFQTCPNGPVVARFEARVTPDRIEGKVTDPTCGEDPDAGTEVFRRLRCAPRPVTDYLESSEPFAWRTDFSDVQDSGEIVYRGTNPSPTLKVWAIAAFQGRVIAVAPGSVVVEGSNGRVFYVFDAAADLLVEVGDEVMQRHRLARLRYASTGQGDVYELTLRGITAGGEQTDPQCIGRQESTASMLRGSPDE